MGRLRLVEAFAGTLSKVTTADALHEALETISNDMGFDFFALAHHPTILDPHDPGVRLHNYPPEWVKVYDDSGFGVSDPVRRASNRRLAGFAWSDIARLIAVTSGDRHVLARGWEHGVGDGYTIPANVPGEAIGSCSFAVMAGRSLPADQIMVAEMVGGLAFECARRIHGDFPAPATPRLTHRQTECVLWSGRGKTDWEIARIMGISHETVIQHLKLARERYGVQKRATLVVRALFDGLFSFADILRRR